LIYGVDDSSKNVVGSRNITVDILNLFCRRVDDSGRDSEKDEAETLQSMHRSSLGARRISQFGLANKLRLKIPPLMQGVSFLSRGDNSVVKVGLSANQ